MHLNDRQGDFFIGQRFDTVNPLLSAKGQPATILIGCGRRKSSSAAPAKSLYTSDRFKKARSIAETLGSKYFIVSGLHGLVEPGQVLTPYDLDLDALDAEKKQRWGADVISKLRLISDIAQVCILSSKTYSDPIIDCASRIATMPSIIAPLAAVDELHHEAWHDQALAASKRVADLRCLYEIIDNERRCGSTFSLRDLAKQELPRRGVYVFLDPDERNFTGTAPRIVRIGTHAISEGSKSLLKTRLRNHLGASNGSGNHRGSIFRLHIGRALLEKDGAQKTLPTWGVGQDAPTEVRTQEVQHEKRVSAYLGRLEVFTIAIDDEPSKSSVRAAVERQLIALCSEALQTIDNPGPNWLGLHSPTNLIVRSGLWNLRDVGREYDATGRGSVRNICSMGA